MSARLALALVGGGDPPRELPEAGMLVVGSSAERAGFVVGGADVDAAHCAIGRIKGGGWALKDLGSRSGTRLNGAPVRSARLAPGDRIGIGDRTLVVSDPEAPTAAPAAGERPAGSPERVGGYRLERLLGRGSMGEVWLAVQESLDRRVALKLLAPRLASDADFVARFQSEARAAAALSHPNVVVVHDVGEADGHHYLSMEYMQGGSLEERLAREGRLPWTEVLDVLGDAASGLGFAEARGVVHRDVKPANLMRSATGTTKIADLGLATSIEAEAQTGEGGRRIFGTPHFMSPEQVRGEPLDHRSDLYSLGASAYRLLAGRNPFEGRTTREILRAVVHDLPIALEHAAPQVPGELANLVHRLLSRDPADRPASAKELLAEIERVRQAAAAPTNMANAAGPMPAESAAPPRRRRALLITLLLLVGATPLAWWLANRGGATAKRRDSGGLATAGPGGHPETTGVPVFEPDADGPGTDGARPGSPPVDAGATTGPGEEELQALEARAEFAWGLIADVDDDRDRLQALRDLALQFPGTTTAHRAEQQAGELEARLAEETRATTARGAALAAARTALRAAAGLEREPPRPALDLAAIGAWSVPPELVDDPAVDQLRAEVAAEVVARALARVEAGLLAADEAAEAGDFERVRAELERLGPVLEPLPAVPSAPDGPGATNGPEVADAQPAPPLPAPPGLDELAARGRAIEERLANLDVELETWRSRTAREDAARVGAALSWWDGLGPELHALDLERAEERLARLEAGLGETPARAWTEALAADVRAAREALRLLIDAWAQGRWRRRTLLDPRGRRGTPREVVGVDAKGVLFDEASELERLPWSAFGANTEALDQLFKGRLDREYDPAERGRIACLLRLTAVVQAIDVAAQMLEPDSRARFSEAEAEALAAAFEPARAWAGGTPVEAALAREEEAARVLARALRQGSEGAPGSAAAGFEELLREHADTLLVALLSDGTPLPAEPVREVPATGDGGSADEVSADGVSEDGASANGGDAAGEDAAGEGPDGGR